MRCVHPSQRRISLKANDRQHLWNWDHRSNPCRVCSARIRCSFDWLWCCLSQCQSHFDLFRTWDDETRNFWSDIVSLASVSSYLIFLHVLQGVSGGLRPTLAKPTVAILIGRLWPIPTLAKPTSATKIWPTLANLNWRPNQLRRVGPNNNTNNNNNTTTPQQHHINNNTRKIRQNTKTLKLAKVGLAKVGHDWPKSVKKLAKVGQHSRTLKLAKVGLAKVGHVRLEPLVLPIPFEHS